MTRVPFAQPLIFEPIFQERIWGGRRLESVFGKKLPPEKRIGESWEIVDRPEAQSVVRQGPLRGKTLHELWRNYRVEIFGESTPDTPHFPLMAKLIDARERLSVQVHPPTEVANKLGGETKTEFWYCAAADPGAELMAGLRRGVTRKEFQGALERGDAAEVVHRIKVRAGDAFFVPSGRIHAIGAGNLIVEISQNSDTTYRVFDWNRAGREMHVEQALASIDFNDFEPQLLRAEGKQLVQCPFFQVEKWHLDKPRLAPGSPTCAIFFCLSGAIEVQGASFEAGDFFLVPASGEKLEAKPMAPETSLLRVTVPNR